MTTIPSRRAPAFTARTGTSPDTSRARGEFDPRRGLVTPGIAAVGVPVVAPRAWCPPGGRALATGAPGRRPSFLTELARAGLALLACAEIAALLLLIRG